MRFPIPQFSSRTEWRGLRLSGSWHVICDNRVCRISAGVGRVPDRHHDQSHYGDDQSCPDDEFDHFRTASVTVKAA